LKKLFTPTLILPLLGRGRRGGGFKKLQSLYKDFQRKLRKNMPLPEVALWQRVRREQLGVKFRRQYAIENRILDFYAPKIRLGIEIDGESHFLSDFLRQCEIEEDKKLEKNGLKILRFLNSEIMKNMDNVLARIKKEIDFIRFN
jgi:very-short-patch-repair endonuclease